jgi:DNA-binding MarR family transcriptional regulator
MVKLNLLQDDRASIATLQAQLMYTIVLPYLGAAAARAELRRNAPMTGEQRTPVQRDSTPLRELDIKLTDRTIRALKATRESPGDNSREVARRCGISDQGQASKLLARLERHGLIENLSQDEKSSAPKEWHILPLGERLLRTADTEWLRLT